MKEGESFPLVADKATWVWTPTVISYMCFFFLLSNQCRRCLKGDTYRVFLVPTDFLFNGGWIARTVYFKKTCLIIFIFLINVKIFSICFSGS